MILTESHMWAYLVQSVLHSLVAFFVVERAIQAWGIRDPREKFRYRLSVLCLPILLFPLFQTINPARGDFFFRKTAALLSSTDWLQMSPLWGIRPVFWLLVLTLLLATISLLCQEVVPMVGERMERTEPELYEPAGPDLASMNASLSRKIGLARPPAIRIFEDEHPVIYSSGTRRVDIMLSDSLMRTLKRPELEAALAHELAHVARRSTVTTLLAYAARLIMFYNPVALLVFRRLVQLDEHICDDLAATVLKDRRQLARALAAFHLSEDELRAEGGGPREAIQAHSHNFLLKERIRRLEAQEEPGSATGIESGWSRFILTQILVIGICYYVV